MYIVEYTCKILIDFHSNFSRLMYMNVMFGLLKANIKWERPSYLHFLNKTQYHNNLVIALCSLFIVSVQ